ncbi:MAG TPA: hypothetical protein VFR04_05055 [Solirubrobacterales bacterium]|nr:hypothetical protein [Solirubrobacterales bacterium]
MSGRGLIALCLSALAACALVAGFSTASFTDTSQNPQTVSAVPDFLAPTASASVIAKSQGGVDGYVKKGGTYYVYAEVSDSGNPASGIASVKANVAEVTAGQTAVSLGSSGGPFSVDGVSYGYRSAQLTAGSSLSAGAKAYTLALADAAGNSRTQSGFSVTVDNGPFAGSEFETANVAGGTAGKAEKGDTVSFTFSKAPDASSIVSGWNGSGAKSVTVSIADSSSNDVLSVSGATVGSVALQGNYTNPGKTTTFTGSSMSVSGSTVTIVLGTDSAGNARTETTKNKPVWTPSASNYDPAGNACSTATVTGESLRQF